MKSAIRKIFGLSAALAAAALLFAGHAEAEKANCLDANTDNDLVLGVPCDVPIGTTKSYRHIHVISNGILNFLDGAGETTIWARAILVEDGGTLRAGTVAKPFGTDKGRLTIYLYGETQGKNGSGVACKSTPAETCGAPSGIFFSNIDSTTHKPKPTQLKVEQLGGASPPVPPAVIASYQGPKNDYFYAYHTLTHDEGNPQGYFGYKVLGVSYGGTLQLFGKKGAIYGSLAADTSCNPTGPESAKSTGRSWVRLARTAQKDATSIYAQTPPCGLDWADKDDIVLTTTDYLPGHSEQLKISGAPALVTPDSADGKADPTLVGLTKISFTPALQHVHSGQRFALDNTAHPGISRVGLNTELTTNGAEVRAVVALLSRSIRIYSAGTKVGEFLPAETDAACTGTAGPETNTCYFGGHTIFRQGFKAVQVQGVEFYQMGQGGRIGHYPIHFHHARKTQDATNSRPPAFVMDSSIWDSMTRWIVLHGTQNVTLARNVGYKSIGHGFYLEDGTETDNKLLANVGVFARAAVANKQNPRRVPGILAAPNMDNNVNFEGFPFKSDYDHPAVFWIMNGWNDFQYNAAAGAGACGACYWLVSGANSTSSRDQKWESYASLQTGVPRAGTTPLKSFLGNACSSAMISFQTVTRTDACLGVGATAPQVSPALPHVRNPMAASSGDLNYYPTVHDTGGRFATKCDATDCSAVPLCGAGTAVGPCVITHLDGYTSSFNWSSKNFSAIWLRPHWYLVDNSVITDVQQAGITMVTGGGYTESDVITGHWALVTKSAFIGHTQENNPFASDGGPFNVASGLRCANISGIKVRPGNFCLNADEGVSFPVDTFGSQYQRLFNVYDGPAVQDSNAYLNIKVRRIDDCKPQLFGVPCPVNDPSSECNPTSVSCPACSGINCHFLDPVEKTKLQCDRVTEGRCVATDQTVSENSAWIAGIVQGLPKGYPDPLHPDESQAFCFMPNAAIGWKQPNGFYYPPAFRSRNLYFNNVDVRHFVVTPLFQEGTLATDTVATRKSYCKWDGTLFNGFNSIDRQTVLNDDDGTLTGYKDTTVINLDDFFLAPVDAIQCLSDHSSRTSPYKYVSTVVYPAASGPARAEWGVDCANEHCFGVPLYRQDLMPAGDAAHPVHSMRMMGQSNSQRSSLTVNHGTYYVDTGVSLTQQQQPGIGSFNVFQANGTYYLFLIFADAATEQKYRFFVGKGTAFNPETDVKMVQARIPTQNITFSDPIALQAGRSRWFDQANGIVEVTLRPADLPGFADQLKAAKKTNCQPQSFCHWNDGTEKCEDINSTTSPKADTICHWGPNDVHCPENGCVGIVFTLPGTFTTAGAPAAPPAQPVDCFLADGKTPTVFNVAFTAVSDGVCPVATDLLEPDFKRCASSGDTGCLRCDAVTGKNCVCVPKP